MRFPNLRYGNPTEFEYYCMGLPDAHIGKILRRDPRTIKDWRSGKAKLPWWVPEIMRLKKMELDNRQYQMFGALATHKRQVKLGIVQPNNVIELTRPAAPPAPHAIIAPTQRKKHAI